MRILNNISPLPFYTSLEQQHHRKKYAFDQIYPLITQTGFLLPFQFLINTDANTSFDPSFDPSFDSKEVDISLRGFYLHRASDNKPFALNSRLLKLIRLNTNTNIWQLYLNDNSALTVDVEPGRYYLSIMINDQRLFSDIFTMVDDVSCYLKLEYSNSLPFDFSWGRVNFPNNFKFKCYLDTEIGKPEYSFEEEVTERMGYSFIESQISKKIYRFTFMAPEYLCDALRLMRLCDYKVITTPHDIYEPISFSIKPSWEEQGDLAAVEAEFEIDTILTNIGNYKI